MNASIQQNLPDSSDTRLAAVLVEDVMSVTGRMQAGTVLRQAQQLGRVSVAW